MTDKQYNKIVDQIVKTAILAELPGITKEEVNNRYNNVLESNGIDKADSALHSTLKQFKAIAKDKESKFWQQVKTEVMEKVHSCPCVVRDLKTMIKSGEIDITGYTREQDIKLRLGI